MSWKFFVQTRPERRFRRCLYLVKEHTHEWFNVSLQLNPVDERADIDRPTLESSGAPSDDVTAFMQAALNAAWELGLRPEGFKDKTDELAAVRYHLEDMRKLAKVKP